MALMLSSRHLGLEAARRQRSEGGVSGFSSSTLGSVLAVGGGMAAGSRMSLYGGKGWGRAGAAAGAVLAGAAFFGKVPRIAGFAGLGLMTGVVVNEAATRMLRSRRMGPQATKVLSWVFPGA